MASGMTKDKRSEKLTARRMRGLRMPRAPSNEAPDKASDVTLTRLIFTLPPLVILVAGSLL